MRAEAESLEERLRACAARLRANSEERAHQLQIFHRGERPERHRVAIGLHDRLEPEEGERLDLGQGVARLDAGHPRRSSARPITLLTHLVTPLGTVVGIPARRVASPVPCSRACAFHPNSSNAKGKKESGGSNGRRPAAPYSADD